MALHHPFRFAVQVLLSSTLISFPLFFISSTQANTSEPPLKVLYDQLLPKLQAGGVTIYLVPFATQGEDQIDKPEWWRNCSFSRSVSAQGEVQAKQFSKAIRDIGITIIDARSGQHCASLTTATFAVANPNIRLSVTPDLNPPDVQRAQGVAINQVIEVRVQAQIQLNSPAFVSLISGWQMTPETTPHPVLTDLQPGETVIFDLDAQAMPRLIARLSTAQWAQMAAYDKTTQRKKRVPPKRTSAAPIAKQ